MKRFISLMLVVMYLVMLVPAEALAFEDGYTLSAKEVKTISEIAGTDSVYREGMKYSASMSAYQKYCWLEDFCEYDLASVKNQCGSILMDDGEAAKLPEFKAIYRAVNELDQLVQYWATDLEREVTAVESAQTALKDKDNLPGEGAQAYRSLTKAKNRINEIYDEMAENDPSGFDATTNEWFAALQEIHEKYVTPEPIRTLSADEFHVIILNSNEFGIQLQTPDKEPVSGAQVTLSDGENTYTLETGAEGTVVFSGGNFTLDGHNEMWGDLYIEKEGLRIYESHGLLMTGGKGVKIVMEPDNGDPYIQYITFRNTDILHGTETIYQTDANTINQPLFVGVHINPGQQAAFVMNYTVLNGTGTKNIERKITVSGTQTNAQNVAVLDLTDKWCSFLAPRGKVSMELAGINGTANEALFERECAIQTEKAVERKPKDMPKGAHSSLSGVSLNFKTGISKYFLSEVDVNFDIPYDIDNLVPFHFSLSPDGTLVLSAAFQMGKKFTDKAKEDADPEDKKKDGWQLQNSEQRRKALSEFFSHTKSFKQLAENAAKSGDPAHIFSWLNVKLKAEIAGVLTANFKPGLKLDGPYDGLVDLFFNASINVTLSKCFYGVLAGFPCYAGFDFTFGVMGGIDLPFKCKSNNGEAWKFWEYTDADFDSKYMDIIVGSRISASGYAGTGIKGLLGICVKGSGTFTFGLHIFPQRSGKNVVKASISLSGNVKLIIEYLFGNIVVSICEGEWSDYNPKEETPASAGGGPLAEALPRYVQATVKNAGTFSNVTDIRTVQSGDSFYSFYVKNTTISGIERPWLRCSVIADDGTVTELPLPHLGEKALASIGADDFPASMYICAFDAVSLKSVYNRENGAEVLALQVIFVAPEIVGTNLFVESYFLYRRPNGEFQQSNCLLNRGVAPRAEEKDAPPLIAHINVNICPHRENADGGVQKFSVMNTFILSDYPRDCDTYQRDFEIDPNTQNVTVQNVNPATSTINLISKRNYDRIEQLELVREDNENVYALVLAKKRDSEDRVLLGMRIQDAMSIVNPGVIDSNVADFTCLPISSDKGINVLVVHDADELGRCAISLTRFGTTPGGKLPAFSEPRQIVTQVSPAYYDLVDLGTSRALYYLDSTTKTDGDMAVPTFAIKAIYLADGSDGDTFASHPFHLAEFRPGDLIVDNGASRLKLSPSNKKFIYGTVLESKEMAGPSDPGVSSSNYIVKHFHFEQTLQVDLQGAYAENMFPKPGETVNLFFPMHNTGNVPLSRVVLSAYATRSGSSERIPLADIEINCVNPEKNSVVNYDLNGEVLLSAEGVCAASQYESTIGEQMSMFLTGTNSSSVNAYATKVLMPDERHVYRSSFIVPKNFKVGDYTIHLAPKSFSTLVKRNALGVYDATGAWTATLENLDSGSKALQSAGGSNNATGDEILTVTAYVQDTGAANGEAVPVSLELTDNEGASVLLEEKEDLLRAFAQSTIIDTEEVDLDYTDLSINANLSLEAGQEIVHIVIRNETASPVDTVKLNFDIDGNECYSAEFKDLPLLYKDTVSIDVPLEKITGGREGELLNLNIVGSENEANPFNNTDSVPLLSSFIITLNPSDQYVMEGGSAMFSVRARGGVEPYTYQWQISMDGQDGMYLNIDGATECDLIIEKAKLKQNGAYVRCLVRDKTGRTLTSNPALLLVEKVPPTGDANNIGVMLAIMLGSAAAIVFLIRKRRLV